MTMHDVDGSPPGAEGAGRSVPPPRGPGAPDAPHAGSRRRAAARADPPPPRRAAAGTPGPAPGPAPPGRRCAPASGGTVPDLLAHLGLLRYDMMTDPHAFPWPVALQPVWKDTGWGTIIFPAALLGIDQQLYEAAAVDGAGRWRRLWHVTLPGIVPVVMLLLILNLGQTLSVGFEQIVLQRDAVGAGAGEVLDTWVYFHGVQDGRWGPAAAVGLVKGVVGTALVLGANKLAHVFGHEGVYSNGGR